MVEGAVGGGEVVVVMVVDERSDGDVEGGLPALSLFVDLAALFFAAHVGKLSMPSVLSTCFDALFLLLDSVNDASV
jgi:hypothetical protein